jgi:hypothetical protein
MRILYTDDELKVLGTVCDARRVMASSAVILRSQLSLRPSKSVGAHSMSVVARSSVFVSSIVLESTAPSTYAVLSHPDAFCST